MSDYNFKVRCLNTIWHELYTIGKIYEIKKGEFIWDDGDSSLDKGCKKFKNISDLNNIFSANFEEVKDATQSNQSIHVTIKDNKVIAILKEDGKIIKKTEAICHTDDEFNFNIGANLAYSRLFDKVKEDDKHQEYKEVKRMAKAGEWVKVTNATNYDFNEHENGSILKIVSVKCGDEAYYKDEYFKYMLPEEYVVLEGYNSIKDTPEDKIDLSSASNSQLMEELNKGLSQD